MVDINNLNRVRGILSARQGAEIPKYLGGAKFAKQKGNVIIYSQDGSKWFSDVNLVHPYIGDTSQFMDVSTPETSPSNIPGANPDQGNPNAAVEASAAQNAAAEQIQQQNAAQTQALQAPIPVTQLPVAGINTPPASELKLPDKIELPAETKAAIEKSAGMNLEYQKQKEAAEKANLAKAKGQVLNGINQGIDALGSVVGAGQEMTDSNTTKTVDAAYDGIADVASNFGPIGKVVGTAMKAASLVGDISQSMGGGTDQQTTMDKIMDSSFFSWNIGMLNGFAGSNTDKFSVDQNLMAQVGSSYGGTVDDLTKAASKAGKKYGLFSAKAKNKANQVIADATSKQNAMESISNAAQDQRITAQSMGEQAGLAYQRMLEGGYDQKYTYVAKQGGILEWNPVETLEWQPRIELNWELPTFKEGGNLEFFEELEWIPEFKEGGKTKESDIPEIEETTQKNVIPEGALHKNKHHMEHAEGLTKKGIPVIDEDGEQQAEIEHSEIIFTLEVTKKLEEYYEIFYSESASNKEKEQAALEAGKLLVYQILENTEDRTGLIESCKKGGTLNFKKSTEDLIEEALEWIPTITIIEEVIEEVKEEEKPKKKSEKEQMKEAIKEVLIELLTK